MYCTCISALCMYFIALRNQRNSIEIICDELKRKELFSEKDQVSLKESLIKITIWKVCESNWRVFLRHEILGKEDLVQ